MYLEDKKMMTQAKHGMMIKKHIESIQASREQHLELGLHGSILIGQGKKTPRSPNARMEGSLTVLLDADHIRYHKKHEGILTVSHLHAKALGPIWHRSCYGEMELWAQTLEEGMARGLSDERETLRLSPLDERAVFCWLFQMLSPSKIEPLRQMLRNGISLLIVGPNSEVFTEAPETHFRDEAFPFRDEACLYCLLRGSHPWDDYMLERPHIFSRIMQTLCTNLESNPSKVFRY